MSIMTRAVQGQNPHFIAFEIPLWHQAEVCCHPVCYIDVREARHYPFTYIIYRVSFVPFLGRLEKFSCIHGSKNLCKPIRVSDDPSPNSIHLSSRLVFVCLNEKVIALWGDRYCVPFFEYFGVCFSLLWYDVFYKSIDSEEFRVFDFFSHPVYLSRQVIVKKLRKVFYDFWIWVL